MHLTIHRGTHEIGGACVELASAATRIILDDRRGCPASPPACDEKADFRQAGAPIYRFAGARRGHSKHRRVFLASKRPPVQ